MKFPSMEDLAAQLMKAMEAFVKEIGEIIDKIIQKLKELFGELF